MEHVPAWQQALRQAQAADNANKDADAQAQADHTIAECRRQGADLRTVLAYFGIGTPELDQNSYTIDQYVFSLDWLALSPDDDDALYSEVDQPDGTKNIQFILLVDRNGVYAEDGEALVVSRSIARDYDWHAERARLATKLDDLDDKFMRIQSRDAAPKPEPTLAQELERLIRQIVASEIEYQIAGDF